MWSSSTGQPSAVVSFYGRGQRLAKLSNHIHEIDIFPNTRTYNFPDFIKWKPSDRLVPEAVKVFWIWIWIWIDKPSGEPKSSPVGGDRKRSSPSGHQLQLSHNHHRSTERDQKWSRDPFPGLSRGSPHPHCLRPAVLETCAQKIKIKNVQDTHPLRPVGIVQQPPCISGNGLLIWFACDV